MSDFDLADGQHVPQSMTVEVAEATQEPNTAAHRATKARRSGTRRTGRAPALPANATTEDLRRWLKELEANEALEAKREPYLKAVRPARSMLVEELFAHYLVAPIDRDRGEKLRLAELRARILGGELGLVSRPRWFDEGRAEPISFADDAP